MVTKEEVQWGNPGALGLACFGFTTLLLQMHNIGLIDSVIPLVYGFFWGGLAQVIAGIIDGRRGDTFGMTAFISYGAFWIGLSFGFLLQWMGFVVLDGPGLAWLCICWGIFTAYMAIPTFKISWGHVSIFVSLVVLYALLAAHFYGVLPVVIAVVEGIYCAASAIYVPAALIVKEKYGRWVFPTGLRS